MKILFQGDSITDAGRNYDDFHDLGNGYAKNAAEKITAAFPTLPFEFIDLGICGNRSIDLVERLQRDFIDVQPDIVSILIGINDVWHRHNHNRPMSDEQFEANYRQVLERIRKETNAKILIMAPFLLPSEDKESWRSEVDSIAGVVRRLAKEYADAYLPLDELFATLPSAGEYARDGVHPNDKGAEFIGSRYLEAITPLIREIAKI
ncbi:MAG: SGNH/GDSL hydrolase family protein [Clostridia bacterium]|nr:SGNH/GDSL hydrolase family protein [Clostridia bacterium]